MNIDYEIHLGTKIDYLCFQSSQLILQNQCEQERTEILTNLLLAHENPPLAGNMFIGNRSIFPETDGAVHGSIIAAKVHTPLRTMNQCYDKIPILYREQIQFVDPII